MNKLNTFVLFLGVSWKSSSFPALFCLTKNVLSLSQYALWSAVNLFSFSILTGIVIKIESMRSFCVVFWSITRSVDSSLNQSQLEETEVWRHVTMVAKCLFLNNLFWQRQPFTLSKDGRRVWAIFFFVLFLLYLLDRGLLMLPHGNVT